MQQMNEVLAQATDNSVWNTDPALVKGAVVGIVGAVASILVIGGYIDDGQKQQLVDNAGILVPAAFAVISILQAIWIRFSVYSPRTAAKIAVVNARQPAGSEPTLLSPP